MVCMFISVSGVLGGVCSCVYLPYESLCVQMCSRSVGGYVVSIQVCVWLCMCIRCVCIRGWGRNVLLLVLSYHLDAIGDETQITRPAKQGPLSPSISLAP